ncbi:MAG: ABC transporter ATP-binding protein [Syntrophobacteraceae bacterium]|nr:ABC transporter ATP-binding protein [Syntrophobacteraceae bacterium]
MSAVISRSSTLKFIRTFSPHLSPYLLLLGFVVVLTLAEILTGLASPLVAGRIIDLLAQPEGLTRLLTSERIQLFFITALFALQAISGYAQTIASSRLGEGFVRDLRVRVFARLMDKPLPAFDTLRAGDASSRIAKDIAEVQEFFTDGLHGILLSLVNTIGAAGAMLFISPQLSILSLVLVPASTFLVLAFRRRVRNQSKGMLQVVGRMSNHVQESVSQIRVIKAFGQEERETDDFGQVADESRQCGVRLARTLAAFSVMNRVAVWVVLIVLLFFSFYLVGRGDITQGELVTFMLFAYRLSAPLSSLSYTITSIQRSIAAGERILEILEGESETDRFHGRLVPDAIQGRIDFENVCFGYNGHHVLQNLSFTIEAGRFAALVGPSGAGKSTVVNLILGFYDIQSGILRMDGRSYDDLNLKEMRRRMAFVPQEPMLFSGTIRDNIAYGMPGATFGQIEEATANANGLDFIRALPKGFETEVGERGLQLSGGERQRIAIARAFLKDPRILILDEATSSLDAETEHQLKKALARLVRGRTSIVIAHRLSTIMDADVIHVFDQGRIVEQGDHAALMARKGLYAHFTSLQLRKRNVDRDSLDPLHSLDA